MSTCHCQAAIILIEKKENSNKILLMNWRPISLLNVDLKIISKAFASNLKTVLPSIISPEETTYIEQ